MGEGKRQGLKAWMGEGRGREGYKQFQHFREVCLVQGSSFVLASRCYLLFVARFGRSSIVLGVFRLLFSPHAAALKLSVGKMDVPLKCPCLRCLCG